jgi:hypothetical protein
VVGVASGWAGEAGAGAFRVERVDDGAGSVLALADEPLLVGVLVVDEAEAPFETAAPGRRPVRRDARLVEELVEADDQAPVAVGDLVSELAELAPGK